MRLEIEKPRHNRIAVFQDNARKKFSVVFCYFLLFSVVLLNGSDVLLIRYSCNLHKRQTIQWDNSIVMIICQASMAGCCNHQHQIVTLKRRLIEFGNVKWIFGNRKSLQQLCLFYVIDIPHSKWLPAPSSSSSSSWAPSLIAKRPYYCN